MGHLFRNKPHVLIDANGSEHRIVEWKAREQTPGLRGTLRRLLGSSFDPVLSFVHQVSPKELAERAMTIALEHELYLDGSGDRRPGNLRKAVAEVEHRSRMRSTSSNSSFKPDHASARDRRGAQSSGVLARARRESTQAAACDGRDDTLLRKREP